MYFYLHNAGRPQLPHYWSIAAIVTIENTAYKGNLREGGEGKKGVGLKRQQVDVHQKVPMGSAQEERCIMCHMTCVP